MVPERSVTKSTDRPGSAQSSFSEIEFLLIVFSHIINSLLTELVWSVGRTSRSVNNIYLFFNSVNEAIWFAWDSFTGGQYFPSSWLWKMWTKRQKEESVRLECVKVKSFLEKAKRIKKNKKHAYKHLSLDFLCSLLVNTLFFYLFAAVYSLW